MNTPTSFEDNRRSPTKTEYAGVVFRSKSEAVFARCLDLSPLVLGWQYEPKVDYGHDWDFHAIVADNADAYGVVPVYQGTLEEVRHYRSIFIEYKPTRPTKTYLDNLVSKTSLAVSKDAACGWRLQDSYLVHGSPWNSDDANAAYGMCPIFSNRGKHGWGCYSYEFENEPELLRSSCHKIEDILGIPNSIVSEAMKYRFDLQHATEDDLGVNMFEYRFLCNVFCVIADLFTKHGIALIPRQIQKRADLTEVCLDVSGCNILDIATIAAVDQNWRYIAHFVWACCDYAKSWPHQSTEDLA